MVLVANNDSYQARLITLIGDYDRESLCNLYQPLVGHVAISLYFTLWTEASNKRINNITHDSLLAKMQLSTGEFIKARKALEGVGLLKTYLEEENNNKTFYYDLLAPKTPSEFFQDTLLYGLLIKYIGEVDAKKLADLYKIEYVHHGNEISSSFGEIFNPNFDDPIFLKALHSAPAKGRNRAKISLTFSYEKLFECLANSGISEKDLTKKELAELSRLSTLYGSNEERIADILVNNYNPSLDKGKRCDFGSITKALQEETNYVYMSSSFSSTKSGMKPKLVSSSNALASKINMMETISPKDFLGILQGGSKAASSDLKIIDSLSKQFHLPNGVLNVVIDYCLGVNDNILSKPYMEKICASLAREGITTAMDTMNYFKKLKNKNKKEANIAIELEKKEEKEDDINWEEMMSKYYGNNEEKDGKVITD